MKRKGEWCLKYFKTGRCGIIAMTLLGLTVGSGCMRLGPEYRKPDTGVQAPSAYQHGVPASLQTPPPDRWWEVFGNSKINHIVAEVVARNLDIKKTAVKIMEIRSQFKQAQADRFPDLNFQLNAQRKNMIATEMSLGRGGLVAVERRKNVDSYSLSFPATFEVDLWGRLAMAEEASRADLLQAEENRLTVTQTIIAEAVTAYLQTEALERRIQITKQSIENYQRNRDLVQRRYERGLTAILDLRQARRVLAQSEASLPELHRDLGLTQQKLAVLLGRYPVTNPPREHQEDYFKKMAPVPSGLPSELLLRRPDIRAAEARLKALHARVGVARANRFPRITLTTSLGYSNNELGHLFLPQSQLWSLATGLMQPLFDAGALKSMQQAAEARYKQGVVEYAQTILKAFAEVEAALLTRKEQLERRQRILKFLEEARATQKVAQSRYERGLADYLNVLNAQQTRFQAEMNLILVDLTILTNRVSLHRALGGGWGSEMDLKRLISGGSVIFLKGS